MAHRSVADQRCAGVDRVLWLTVELRDGKPCGGTVHGVRHRRPADVVVTTGAVHRLLAAGVPAAWRGC